MTLSAFYEQQCYLQEQLASSSDGDTQRVLIRSQLHETLSQKPIFFPELEKSLQTINTNKPIQLSSLADTIVILDFFTYCCINCLHILPTLKKIETKYENKVAVIGIHSAKFNNEKNFGQVVDAASRYDITHPIVCDPEGLLWNKLNLSCWPTIIIIGPKNQFLFQLIGEASINSYLELYISVLIETFPKECIFSYSSFSLPRCSFSTKYSLRYPGKLEFSKDGTKLAISDSGNNRILVVNLNDTFDYGTVELVFNSCNRSVGFSNPQGIAWLDNEILIADTGNNCIKKISLMNHKNIKTLAANRIQSPWDICLLNNDLFIASAGSHQIFKYILSDFSPSKMNDNLQATSNSNENSTNKIGPPPEPDFSLLKLSKNKVDKSKYSELEVFAGNGKEENRNNKYPLKAGFSQPSGITYSPSLNSFFVADSESSSIRQITLDGIVSNVVGANRDPSDLFDFGDKDGVGYECKLQHPMGICWDHWNENLLIADTYNHKIKKINVKSRHCETIKCFNDLNEPSDICVHPIKNWAFIVDTNNHVIKIYKFDSKQSSILKLNFDKVISDSFEIKNDKIINLEPLRITPRDITTLKLRIGFINGYPTPSAPHQIELNLSDTKFRVEETNLSIMDFNNIIVKLIPNYSCCSTGNFCMEMKVHIYYCSNKTCKVDTFLLNLPFIIDSKQTLNQMSAENIIDLES